MNTGFLGPAVATVLTVYGIETLVISTLSTTLSHLVLQQYLPFTVLKLYQIGNHNELAVRCNSTYRLRY